MFIRTALFTIIKRRLISPYLSIGNWLNKFFKKARRNILQTGGWKTVEGSFQKAAAYAQ